MEVLAHESSSSESVKKKKTKRVVAKFDDLLQNILKECTRDVSPAAEEQWNHYLQLKSLIQNIRNREELRGKDLQSLSSKGSNGVKKRKDYLPDFLDWLKNNEVSLNNVEIRPVKPLENEDTVDVEDYGLFFTQHTKNGDVLFDIPKSLIISPEKAEKAIGVLASRDALLKGMENVQLAVFLLHEKFHPDRKSFYEPYLNFLPSKFSTVYNYTEEEMEILFKYHPKAFSESLKMYRHVARQFAYLHNVFRVSKDSFSRTMKSIFTYDRYAYCVSVITTRLNRTNESSEYSLIPLYDMANHSTAPTFSSKISDDYVSAEASEDCSAGTECTMNYGVRSSVDFLVHNGFVPRANMEVHYELLLGISTNDRKYKEKQEGLGFSKKEFVVPAMMNEEFTIKGDLARFLKVFLGTDDEQEYYKFLNVRFTILSKAIDPNIEAILEAKSNELSCVSKQLLSNLYHLLLNEKVLLNQLACQCCKRPHVVNDKQT